MFYRGKEGQWSWIFHRITGVGVLLFLVIHILDTILVGWGPELYDKIMAIYRHPLFKLSEIFLFAAVLYHSLNGLRIILIDFWPSAVRHHKRIFYAMMAIFVAGLIPVSVIMLGHIFH
jgi:succinate dehydrogenase / fumarate reductase cytochrome b subunit